MTECKPSIIFHIVDDKNHIVKRFGIKLEFLGKEEIDLNNKLIISDKYFTKIKDKFKTNIILNADKNKFKFVITLYYGENHITIFKSLNVGICYEIIQIYSKSLGIPLEKIYFDTGKNNEISVDHFDTINNNFRRRFLIQVIKCFCFRMKLSFKKIT